MQSWDLTARFVVMQTEASVFKKAYSLLFNSDILFFYDTFKHYNLESQTFQEYK